jgi:hypothetical protein
VGLISYSLYLWHWPLIVFARYFSAGDLTKSQTAAVIALALIAAVISYKFIESPFRGKGSPITRGQVFSFGFAASSGSLALALVIVSLHGFPGRYSGTTREVELGNIARKTDYREVCPNFLADVHILADINFCTFGEDAPKKILFWGDSHVQQLYPLVEKLYTDGSLGGHGAIFAISNGCIPSAELNGLGRARHCNAFANLVMQRALQESDIDTVFIGFNTWWSIRRTVCRSFDDKCIESISSENAGRVFLQELGVKIQALRKKGKNVIISLPFPVFNKSIPDLQIRNAVFGRFGVTANAVELTLPSVREDIATLAQNTGAEIFDPRTSLCRPNCVTELNGLSIYLDQEHLVASQVGILEDNLRQTLDNSVHK